MKKRSIVTIACLSIVLCVALIAGGTYALFSSKTSVTNHLRSGNLTLKLERVGLTKYAYDEASGEYKENVYTNGDAYVDFSQATEKNVFDIARSEVIAPGVWYEATMRISKDNTNVPFAYKIIVKLNGSKGEDGKDNAFASQLRIYVDGAPKGYLSEYVTAEGGNEISVSSGTIGLTEGSKEFKVKLLFDPTADNNAVMNSTADFDLIVEATQGIDDLDNG